MIVRVGIPGSFPRLTAAARELDAPILISANALRRQTGRFRTPDANLFSGCGAALDSAGFVAMVKYGGYRWTVDEYAGLAGSYPWDWWAAMDFCCESEVAHDRAVVLERVELTAKTLGECRLRASELGMSAPMPVLQGWFPDDYRRCADLSGELPDLVGVGSVCRRAVNGGDGLLRIIDALDRHLPRSVKLHLFGVKGTALPVLAGHPRILSTDSMAWDARARAEASALRLTMGWTRGDPPIATIEQRIRHMRRWYLRQVAALEGPEQMDLFRGAA